MSRSKRQSFTPQLVECVIEKLVHGGQGLGVTNEGKRVFAWNALPGERVVVQTSRSKTNYLEGVAVKILQTSPERIDPVDEAYLSTSPWQIMSLPAEQAYKLAVLTETFTREHVAYDKPIVFQSIEESGMFHYRNKMEYSFWADDAGLHLALFHRGSHGKRIITGSSLAMPVIDVAANKILDVLRLAGIRGSQLKTLVLRANQQGSVVAALFVKDQTFPDLPQLGKTCQGVQVCYSNPKSPASIVTSELQSFGTTTLADHINGIKIQYNVHSFFQVNLPVSTQALDQIAKAVEGKPAVDMYSGVGTIGLTIGGANTLVESDASNCVMARQNATATAAQVVEAPAEQALTHIDQDHVLIVDPPRAGLHTAVVERIRSHLPPLVVYLSCNPITQARDIAMLQDSYSLESLEGYNFFPRTPHIESLAVLRRK